MRCINRKYRNLAAALVTLILAGSLTGCGTVNYDMQYDTDYGVSSYRVNVNSSAERAKSFAQDLCVADGDIEASGQVDMETASVAGLFDLKDADTLYAKNIYATMNPASLTKIMTALTALKYGSAEQMLKASENCVITESGAQLSGIKPGDQMTLNQALHILLIYSANDVAIMIAEGVAGSVDNFCNLMNEEAAAIGATGSHFLNPNGLTQEGHFVTGYDMYLIFNEAMKYELFNEIIQMPSYTTTYTLANGESKELTVNNTNRYMRDNLATAPEKITVIGGKTGTTAAAGHCLILLSRDSSGNPYISVIMNSDSTDNMYLQMNELLDEINRQVEK